jgi:hypothetical protein
VDTSRPSPRTNWTRRVPQPSADRELGDRLHPELRSQLDPLLAAVAQRHFGVDVANSRDEALRRAFWTPLQPDTAPAAALDEAGGAGQTGAPAWLADGRRAVVGDAGALALGDAMARRYQASGGSGKAPVDRSLLFPAFVKQFLRILRVLTTERGHMALVPPPPPLPLVLSGHVASLTPY